MSSYIEHHGILGQKWGVRRYQNADGTRTAAGKKRTSESTTEKKQIDKKKAAKIIGATVLSTAAVAAGIAYGSNPAIQAAVNQAVSKMANKTVSSVKAMPQKTLNTGKKAVDVMKESAKNAGKEFVKGIPAGAGEMGNKMGKVVGGGIMALAAKEVADMVIGEDSIKVVVNAYNSHNKKSKVNYNFNQVGNNVTPDDD